MIVLRQKIFFFDANGNVLLKPDGTPLTAADLKTVREQTGVSSTQILQEYKKRHAETMKANGELANDIRQKAKAEGVSVAGVLENPTVKQTAELDLANRSGTINYGGRTVFDPKTGKYVSQNAAGAVTGRTAESVISAATDPASVARGKAYNAGVKAGVNKNPAAGGTFGEMITKTWKSGPAGKAKIGAAAVGVAGLGYLAGKGAGLWGNNNNQQQ